MYWALMVFYFIVAVSGVACVFGQSDTNPSSPLILALAAILAALALILMLVTTVLRKVGKL